MTELAGIIIAICAGSMTMVGTVVALFLWSRGETSAQITAMRSDTSVQISSQITAIRSDVSAIHAEIKDFHGRLCAIEERRLKEK